MSHSRKDKDAASVGRASCLYRINEGKWVNLVIKVTKLAKELYEHWLS